MVVAVVVTEYHIRWISHSFSLPLKLMTWRYFSVSLLAAMKPAKDLADTIAISMVAMKPSTWLVTEPKSFTDELFIPFKACAILQTRSAPINASSQTLTRIPTSVWFSISNQIDLVLAGRYVDALQMYIIPHHWTTWWRAIQEFQFLASLLHVSWCWTSRIRICDGLPWFQRLLIIVRLPRVAMLNQSQFGDKRQLHPAPNSNLFCLSGLPSRPEIPVGTCSL